MTHRLVLSMAAGLAVSIAGTSCEWMPGKPKRADAWKPYSSELDFAVLFKGNCLGCHSDGSTVSPSNSMRDPLYLAFIPPATMRKVIADGVAGTAMPGFARAHGGALTDQQIDVLVSGIYAWQAEKPGGKLPAYSAPLGNAAAGAKAFAVYCGSCHGSDGAGVPGKAGSVVEPSYLGLVSDQYLRTITVVGRPDLGTPNFATYVPGRTMSDSEVADVTAWLASHRRSTAGPPPEVSQR